METDDHMDRAVPPDLPHQLRWDGADLRKSLSREERYAYGEHEQASPLECEHGSLQFLRASRRDGQPCAVQKALCGGGLGDSILPTAACSIGNLIARTGSDVTAD